MAFTMSMNRWRPPPSVPKTLDTMVGMAGRGIMGSGAKRGIRGGRAGARRGAIGGRAGARAKAAPSGT